MTDHANPTPAIDALLADLAAKEEAATRRPWSVYNSCSWRRIGLVSEHREILWPAVARGDGHPDISGVNRDADLALIVAAVNALPALRGEIERLRAELARARGYEQEAVSHLRAVCDPCGNHVTAVMGARAWLVGGHDA